MDLYKFISLTKRAFHSKAKEERLKEVFSILDTDKNGTITLDEFFSVAQIIKENSFSIVPET